MRGREDSSKAPLPDAKQVPSLYRAAVRNTPPLQQAAFFFSLYLRGLETPVVRVQGYFAAALEKLLRKQARLFLSQAVLNAMNRGMTSTYISVREKSLKLLSSAAAAYPRLLSLYLSVVLRGCTDRGISVRKVSYRLLSQLLHYLQTHGLQDTRDAATALKLFRTLFDTATSEEDAGIRSICVDAMVTAWLFETPLDTSLRAFLAKTAGIVNARVSEMKAQSGAAVDRVETTLQSMRTLLQKRDGAGRMARLSEWTVQTLCAELPVVSETVKECLEVLQLMTQLSPQHLTSQLLPLQCSIERLLEKPSDEKKQRQVATYLCGKLLEVLQPVLKESTVSPAVSDLERCLLRISLHATSVSLVEKAAEGCVIIVGVRSRCDVGEGDRGHGDALPTAERQSPQSAVVGRVPSDAGDGDARRVAARL